MRRQEYLRPLFTERPDRVGRDRLEILTALIGGPSFDPVYRSDVIEIPRGHAIYRWECVVGGCERTRTGGSDLCSDHQRQWVRDSEHGVGRAAFVAAAQGLERHVGAEETVCRICPDRPAAHSELRLCQRHLSRWKNEGADSAAFVAWVSGEQPCPGYGPCGAVVCPNLADSPLGLCSWHGSRYRRDGRPGDAVMPDSWWQRYEQFGKTVPIEYGDQAAFRRWCASVPAHPWPGQINLRGLRPLVRAEIQWGLFVHTRRARPSRWDLGWIRSLVNTCRSLEVNSLVDFEFGAGGSSAATGAITKEILHELRLVYFTPDEAKDAGFLETEHFGVLFPHRMSHIDLTSIPQRWLRDLTWDYLADLLRSPRCPRSAGPIDGLRRAAIELGVFLEVEAPGGGHDPTVLREEHAQRFVADQRR